MKKETFENFVKRLDQKKEGETELWIIFVFSILANYNLPSEEQVKDYENSLTNFNPLIKEIPKDDFLKAKAWFDED